MLTLIIEGFKVLLVDVDNAVYIAGNIGKMDAKEQHRYLYLVISAEFIMRGLLLWIFGWLISGDQPLFYIGTFPVTAETIALLAAGSYLLINSMRELVNSFLEKRGSEAEIEYSTDTGLGRIARDTVILSVMSIDTILIILNSTNELWMMLFLLLFSAVARLLFVQAISGIVLRNPGIQLFVIFLLGIIGFELIGQAFGFDQEMIFNTLVLLALLIAIYYQVRGEKQFT